MQKSFDKIIEASQFVANAFLEVALVHNRTILHPLVNRETVTFGTFAKKEGSSQQSACCNIPRLAPSHP
jgi:hypothetical protein